MKYFRVALFRYILLLSLAFVCFAGYDYLKKVWDKVVNNLNGEITTLLRNVFGTSDKINFKIVDGNINGYSARTQVTNDNISNGIRSFDVKVTLNKNVLHGAAQEYIATTIVHEIMHAYFDSNITHYQQQFAQHEDMASGYIEALKNGVKDIYPYISNKDAYALILNGFGDIFKNDLPYWNELLSKYDLNNSQIIDTRDAYKDPNSTRGTRCPK